MPDALPVHVQLRYDDGSGTLAWHDVTDYVRAAGRITVQRGFTSTPGHGVAEPSWCSVVFDNTDGRFTPNNARSPLVWPLTVGTPLRVYYLLDDGTTRAYRFHGEIAEFTPSSNTLGTDRTCAVKAYGPLRRLGRSDELASTLRMFCGDPNNGLDVLAYWPLELPPESDPQVGDTIGSGLPGTTGAALAVAATGFVAGAATGWLGSADLPALGTGVAVGDVRVQGAGTSWTVLLMVDFPDAAPAVDTTLVQVVTTGAARTWRLYLHTSGSLRLSMTTDLGVTTTVVTLGGTVYTDRRTIALEVEHSAGNVDATVAQAAEGASSGTSGTSTWPVSSLGTPAHVQIGGGDCDAAIGHLLILDGTPGLFSTLDAASGYRGHTVSERLFWLGGLQGVTVYGSTSVGGGGTPNTCGSIQQGSPYDGIVQAAALDGAVFDSAYTLSLTYVAEHDRTSENAAILELDYADVVSLTYVDDTESITNDVTATRTRGASARYEVATGAKSTDAPPFGAGRYAADVTVLAETDAQVPGQASWRALTSTWPEGRVTDVVLDLVATPGLIEQLCTIAGGSALNVYDQIVISGLPDWLPLPVARVQVIGYTEIFHTHGWRITFRTVPQAPHDYAELPASSTDGSMSRLDAGTSSTLDVDVDADDTTLVVTTDPGYPVWITTAGHASSFPFDIMIGAERMTVTAVTGSASPQSFTVTRGVDGWAGAHAAGAYVTLHIPRRLNRP